MCDKMHSGMKFCADLDKEQEGGDFHARRNMSVALIVTRWVDVPKERTCFLETTDLSSGSQELTHRP